MTLQFRMLLPGLAAALTVGASGVAVAQEGGINTEGGLEVITVTARKREENILQAPVAITAFSAQQIEALGLQDIQDIQLFTPGFVYEAFATQPSRNDQSPRFRGVDIDTASPLRQTASVFVDGVFVINSASGIHLNDIERVEVIKGPQSAYFGRNTFGGAVNYITRTPTDEFAGRVALSAAEFDDYEVTASIEGPLSDQWSGRLSALYHDDGGHYRNQGNPGQKLGEEETIGATGTLFYEPSERFNAKFRLNYFENDDGPPAVSRILSDQHNCGDGNPGGTLGPSLGGTFTAYCGELPFAQSGGQNTDTSTRSQLFFDSLEEIQAILGNSNRRSFGFGRESLTASALLEWDITDNLRLNSTTGYNDEESDYLQDNDESVLGGFDVVNGREFESFSQEIRLSGIAFGDRLDWMLGVNYFDQRFTSAGKFINARDVPVFGTAPDDIYRFTPFEPSEENIETLGIFGSLIYRFSDQWTVTAEVRRQIDDVSEDSNISDADPGLSGEFKNTLPRIILDYSPTDSTLIYLSYSEGNQPGGFNDDFRNLSDEDRALVLAIVPEVSELLEEEELQNIEFGVKHGFANGKGSVAAAIFMMERTNQAVRRTEILSNGTTVNLFVNVGSSDIEGFELEGRYQFFDNFRVEGTAAYLNAEYVNATSTNHDRLYGTFQLAGRTAGRYPEWSGSLSLVTDNDLANGNTWFGRLDTTYVGERFAGETNEAFAEDGIIANLRLGLQTENIRYEFFVKNLTDSDVPTAVGKTGDLTLPNFSGFSVFGYRGGLRDRRQAGLRVTMDF